MTPERAAVVLGDHAPLRAALHHVEIEAAAIGSHDQELGQPIPVQVPVVGCVGSDREEGTLAVLEQHLGQALRSVSVSGSRNRPA